MSVRRVHRKGPGVTDERVDDEESWSSSSSAAAAVARNGVQHHKASVLSTSSGPSTLSASAASPPLSPVFEAQSASRDRLRRVFVAIVSVFLGLCVVAVLRVAHKSRDRAANHRGLHGHSELLGVTGAGAAGAAAAGAGMSAVMGALGGPLASANTIEASVAKTRVSLTELHHHTPVVCLLGNAQTIDMASAVSANWPSFHAFWAVWGQPPDEVRAYSSRFPVRPQDVMGPGAPGKPLFVPFPCKKGVCSWKAGLLAGLSVARASGVACDYYFTADDDSKWDLAVSVPTPSETGSGSASRTRPPAAPLVGNTVESELLHILRTWRPAVASFGWAYADKTFEGSISCADRFSSEAVAPLTAYDNGNALYHASIIDYVIPFAPSGEGGWVGEWTLPAAWLNMFMPLSFQRHAIRINSIVYFNSLVFGAGANRHPYEFQWRKQYEGFLAEGLREIPGYLPDGKPYPTPGQMSMWGPHLKPPHLTWQPEPARPPFLAASVIQDLSNRYNVQHEGVVGFLHRWSMVQSRMPAVRVILPMAIGNRDDLRGLQRLFRTRRGDSAGMLSALSPRRGSIQAPKVRGVLFGPDDVSWRRKVHELIAEAPRHMHLSGADHSFTPSPPVRDPAILPDIPVVDIASVIFAATGSPLTSQDSLLDDQVGGAPTGASDGGGGWGQGGSSSRFSSEFAVLVSPAYSDFGAASFRWAETCIVAFNNAPALSRSFAGCSLPPSTFPSPASSSSPTTPANCPPGFPPAVQPLYSALFPGCLTGGQLTTYSNSSTSPNPPPPVYTAALASVASVPSDSAAIVVASSAWSRILMSLSLLVGRPPAESFAGLNPVDGCLSYISSPAVRYVPGDQVWQTLLSVISHCTRGGFLTPPSLSS